MRVQRPAEDEEDEWALIESVRAKTGGASKVARCHVMLGQTRGVNVRWLMAKLTSHRATSPPSGYSESTPKWAKSERNFSLVGILHAKEELNIEQTTDG